MLDTLKGFLQPAKSEKVDTSDIDELFESAKNARLPMERVWMENLSFYMGKQWLIWNDQTKTLEPPDVPEWKVLITVNLVQPRVLTEYAKLTQNRPTAQVRPLSAEADDVRRARTNNKILDYLWKQSDSETAKNNGLLWSLVCGTGILKPYWDPDKGPKIEDPERGISMALGEVCVYDVSPLEFYPSPLARNIKECTHAFHVKLRTKSYVQDKYGIEVEEEEYADSQHLEGRLALLTDQATQGNVRGVLVREFWEPPSKKYPKGRFQVKAGDREVKATTNPYPKVPIPFVSWQHRPVPGRFWGDSIPTQMADVQRNYNKARSQAIEIRNLMAKPKWKIPIGSLPSGKPITSAPGEMIEYVPIGAHSPEPISGRDVPPTFWRDLEQTLREVNEVSGQHEVTNAQVPGQVKAGVAIQALQEQDDIRLTPAAQKFEDAISSLESFKLKLAKQFYQEPRVARIIGEGDHIEVVEFTRDDILEDADVIVEAGSSLPRSLTAKREFITSLVELGVLKDPRMIARLLEFDQVQELFEEVNRDINQAERENDRMTGKVSQGKDEMTGEPIPGTPTPVEAHNYDNHEMHIYTHNKFRKSEEFEQMDPSIHEIFDQHVEGHKMLAMSAALTAPMSGEGGGAAEAATASATQPATLK